MRLFFYKHRVSPPLGPSSRTRPHRTTRCHCPRPRVRSTHSALAPLAPRFLPPPPQRRPMIRRRLHPRSASSSPFPSSLSPADLRLAASFWSNEQQLSKVDSQIEAIEIEIQQTSASLLSPAIDADERAYLVHKLKQLREEKTHRIDGKKFILDEKRYLLDEKKVYSRQNA